MQINRRSITKKGVTVLVAIIVVAAMATPTLGVPTYHQQNLSTGETTELLEQTSDTSPYNRTALAAYLLGADFTNTTHSAPPPSSLNTLPPTQYQPSEDTQLKADSQQIQNVVGAKPGERMEDSLDQYHGEDQAVSAQLFSEHASAISALAPHTAQQAGTDTRINASTSLLVVSDRKLVQNSINETRHIINSQRSELAPGQVKQAEKHLQTAVRKYESTEPPKQAEKRFGEEIQRRAQTVRTLREAWEATQRAASTVNEGTPPTLTITARGDPVRNGTQTTTRNVSGTITGVQKPDVNYVLIEIGESRTVKASVSHKSANAVTFTKEVTFKSRTIEITAEAVLGEGKKGGDQQNKNGKTRKKAGQGQGQNQGTVPSSDSPPKVDTLQLDGDGVTDTFEDTVLGTDPLNPNSDIPKTDMDESNDTVVDGGHDPDEDALVNSLEDTYGLDPFNPDTDGDGIEDGIEIQFPQLNATQSDVNENGVPDGQDDPDGDTLSTSEEIENGTAPFDADTDQDTLQDNREYDIGTDPLTPDTDEDGLSDADELSLGTDPLDADTDGDGVLDGNETFTTESRNETIGASVEITGEGNVSTGVTIQNGSNPQIANTSTVQDAKVSPVVEYESEKPFESATVTIPYDESEVNDPSNIAVYRENETTGAYEPLDSTVKPSEGVVKAETEHFSKFVVFRISNWQSNYKAVEPPSVGDGGGDAAVAPVDAMFILDSSGSMSNNDPQNLRLQASKEFVGALIQGDRAGVVDFDNSAQLRQSLTTDFTAVNNSIDQIDSSGGTTIEAGLRTAIDEYDRSSNTSRAKIAILLTDGRNGGSNAEVRQQAQRAADRNITVYTIGFGSANAQLLSDVAETTNGNFTSVSSPEELPDVFKRIAEETSASDSDGDGLNDTTELAGFIAEDDNEYIRTDPFDPDTDGDGIPDGKEVGPKVRIEREVTVTVAGSNGDPVTKSVNQTVRRLVSDPTAIDSDYDGLPDAGEYGTYSVEFTSSAQQTRAFKKKGDTQTLLTTVDVDSLTESESVSPNPNEYDSDGDNISDGREVTIGTNPVKKDTDGDRMSDWREMNKLPEEDATLFDARAPDVTIQSIKSVTVGNVVGGKVDVFDTKYEARYKIHDPAGIDRAVMKKGDTSKSVEVDLIDGTTAVITQDVIAESFLEQGQDIFLGVTAEFKVVDENGNGDEFVTRGGPNILTTAVLKIGNLAPDAIPPSLSPTTTVGVLAGFAEGIVSAVTGLYDLLVRLLGDLGGMLNKFGDVLATILKSGLNVLKIVAEGVQKDMENSNPFDVAEKIKQPDNGINTVLDAVFDSALNGSLIDRLGGLEDYTQYGLGWYEGYLLSYIAPAIFSGGSSAVASASSRLSILLQYTATALNVNIPFTGIGVLNAVSVVEAVSAGDTVLDKGATTGVLVATKGFAAVEQAQVVARTANLPGATTIALDFLVNHDMAPESGASKLLSQYLAATNDDGASLFKTEPNAMLISSVTGVTTDRVIVGAAARDELTDSQVKNGLGQLLGVIPADDSRTLPALNRIVTYSGTAGVMFLADSLKVVDVVKQVQTNDPFGPLRSPGEKNLHQLLRQSGGANVTTAVNTLGVDTTVDLLRMTSSGGADDLARSRLVDAVAAGTVSASEAQQYINTVQSLSVEEREKRLDELAVSRNPSETAAIVQDTIS